MTLQHVLLADINLWSRNTLIEHLGIECIELGDDYLVARMPVDHRTHQPAGLLHGGASMALIESLGSMGSSLLLDRAKEQPVGIEINANHISGVRSGSVLGTARIVHAGRKTHVWQVDIRDEASGRHVCTGRLTVMVIARA